MEVFISLQRLSFSIEHNVKLSGHCGFPGNIIVFLLLCNADYSKTCLKLQLQKDKTKELKTNASLMKVKSNASFCNAFDLY